MVSEVFKIPHLLLGHLNIETKVPRIFPLLLLLLLFESNGIFQW